MKARREPRCAQRLAPSSNRAYESFTGEPIYYFLTLITIRRSQLVGSDDPMNHDETRDPMKALEEWLDIQESSDDTGEIMFRQDDFDDLWTVGCLARAHAPEAQLRAAVLHARQAGWGWHPLALSLGISANEARRRYADHPARQPTPHWWSRFRSHPASDENPRGRVSEATPPPPRLSLVALPAQRTRPLTEKTRAQR
jgi:hypothetical protein